MTKEEKKVAEEVNTLFQACYWLYPGKFTITAENDEFGWIKFSVENDKGIVCVFTLTNHCILHKLVVVNDFYFFTVLFLEDWTKFIRNLHEWTYKRLMKEDRIDGKKEN